MEPSTLGLHNTTVTLEKGRAKRKFRFFKMLMSKDVFPELVVALITLTDCGKNGTKKEFVVVSARSISRLKHFNTVVKFDTFNSRPDEFG